jgi:hypothetical protein
MKFLEEKEVASDYISISVSNGDKLSMTTIISRLVDMEEQSPLQIIFSLKIIFCHVTHH